MRRSWYAVSWGAECLSYEQQVDKSQEIQIWKEIKPN